MAGMVWRDEYSIGVASVDEEHKRIIEMINAAYAAFKDTGDSECVRGIVDGMRAYAESHFLTEETLMGEHGYPEADRHLAEHAYFRQKLEEIDNAHAQATDGVAPDPVQLYQFLSKWLISHIMHCDRKLGDYLMEQGVS